MTRTSRTSGLVAVLALGTIGLAACGPGGGRYSSSGTTSGASSTAGSGGGAASGASVLTTAGTGLGTVVVDAKGRTVYFYDKDSAGSGKSACSGACAGIWPAVTASGTPSVKGVTGKVATITRDDGTKQVTLEGHPIYTFSGDAAAGDTSGQGYKGVWWAVSPAGAAISATDQSPSGY